MRYIAKAVHDFKTKNKNLKINKRQDLTFQKWKKWEIVTQVNPLDTPQKSSIGETHAHALAVQIIYTYVDFHWQIFTLVMKLWRKLAMLQR